MKILDVKKVRTVGNSKVMTLSNEVLEALNLDVNDNVVIALNERNEIIIVPNHKENTEVDSDFTNSLKNMSSLHSEVVKELVDK